MKLILAYLLLMNSTLVFAGTVYTIDYTYKIKNLKNHRYELVVQPGDTDNEIVAYQDNFVQKINLDNYYNVNKSEAIYGVTKNEIEYAKSTHGVADNAYLELGIVSIGETIALPVTIPYQAIKRKILNKDIDVLRSAIEPDTEIYVSNQQYFRICGELEKVQAAELKAEKERLN